MNNGFRLYSSRQQAAGSRQQAAGNTSLLTEHVFTIQYRFTKGMSFTDTPFLFLLARVICCGVVSGGGMQSRKNSGHALGGNCLWRK